MGKEPWQIEFENEEINDERWSCLVSAVVESKPDDEECFEILNQHVKTGKIALVRTVSMADVIALFKIPTENKRKEEANVKVKSKMDNADDSSLLNQLPPSRFPEIVSFLSKYAVLSDGSCKLAPELMGYAIKYLILLMKDQDYMRRRIARTVYRRTKEAEVLKTLKGGGCEAVIPEGGERNELWQRDKFDIFNDPYKDGPFQGPELYIALHGFYDLFVFLELLRLKVPFRAVIKIENFQSISGKTISSASSKKLDMINNFWKLLEGNVSDDIALLKYLAPSYDKGNTNMSSAVTTGLTALLYSVFNLHRLHETYIQQMRVHRMIESLELLDLSKCFVYKELCDALVKEDQNAEIFVLFSMIEQVVVGVPETENRAVEYKMKASSFFTCGKNPVGKRFVPEEHQYPDEPRRNNVAPRKNGGVCFYGDKISLTTLSLDPCILKSNEIFERFLINSISSKIRNKFSILTPALKVQSYASFYRMWQNNTGSKDNFRTKLFFLIAMRLIERIKVPDIGCDNVSSHSEAVLSLGESTENSSKEGSIMQDELRYVFFSDIVSLFYKQSQSENEYVKSSSVATKEVRKAEAISVLEGKNSLSFESLEMACGRCPKFSVHEKSPKHQVELRKLEQFLESHEISHLNDPNLLADQKKFEDFVDKHRFYETFEPNRTVQRLQELYDQYNTVEYTYFSPTDTLFVLGHNDSDFRGIYHSVESGFITSPLSLRDFVSYVLPENKKWVAMVNAKYIKFLKEDQIRILDEEKRKTHDVFCDLMKVEKGMNGTERRRFLHHRPARDKDSELDIKKLAKERMVETQVVELDDLPVKGKQRQPDVKFFGLNCGGTRTQVNVVNYEFHSEDGSMVSVKTQSWLHSESVVTLIVQRLDCRLFVHRWLEGTEKRMMLFRDPSGILVTFGLDTHPLPVKITQPNGLLIEIGTRKFHIKQTYMEPYRWGDDISKEKSRCYLQDGSVLIFCVDGTVEVLYPSGTKHTCHGFASGVGVKISETLTPTGELWVQDDCSKCKHLGKRIAVIVGVDSVSKEIYYRREDGTNCMLWPDGKLVTTYPDGTKITTMPKFEKEELVIETSEKGSTISTTTDGPRINFLDDPQAEGSSGFTVVICSYLIEHPKYATVYAEPSKLEVRCLGKMRAEMSSNESLRIECHHSVFKVSPENAEFYTVCKHCGKRSISTVFFGSENLLSKSKDYDGHRFDVYSSGQILYKPKKDFNNEEDLENTGKSPPTGKSSGNCKHPTTCRTHLRCLTVERDLTGMEFIDIDALHRYQGSLSQDAYYDLGKLSVDKTHLQHSFFDPVYRIGRDKYVMKYENDDGFPTRLTRKYMRNGSVIDFKTDSAREWKRRQLPKMVVVRFIRVLLPHPITIMKEIAKEIAIYRRRSLDVSKKYGNISKKGKQCPFAKSIARELELIASTFCPSLKLYQHTCTIIPYTEVDVHSAVHRFDMNNYLVKSKADDCRSEILPECKQILKPLKHSGNEEGIHEVTNNDESDSDRL